jgi:hypothetical protein
MSFANWIRGKTHPKEPLAVPTAFWARLFAVLGNGAKARSGILYTLEDLQRGADSFITWDETPYENLFAAVAYSNYPTVADFCLNSYSTEEEFYEALAYCKAVSLATEAGQPFSRRCFEDWEHEWWDFVEEYPNWVELVQENL